MFHINSLRLATREEIAYDGLEGITLEALWQRLAAKFQQPLTPTFCNKTFQSILKMQDMNFFELPEPRLKLIIRNRLESDNAADQNVPEPENKVYKYIPISVNGVRGSCEDFATRKPVHREDLLNKSLAEIEEKWNTKLVIVAPQTLRESLLIPTNVWCSIELSITQYCILEKIGRSRFQGELSQGHLSLQEFLGEPKFNHCDKKFFIDSKLVITQTYYQRVNAVHSSCHLFHLPQFYIEVKSKKLRTVEKLFDYLKSKKNYMSDVEDVRCYLEVDVNGFKKLIQNSEFSKLFAIDNVLYRSVYPNANSDEYKFKKKNTEKTLRVVVIKDPNMDIFKIWNKDGEQDVEDESESFLDIKNQYFDVEILRQTYNVIEKSKGVGLSQAEVGRILGLTKLNSRAVCKNLVKLGYITTYIKDEGRQRTTKYLVVKYEGQQNVFSDEANILNSLVNNKTVPETSEESSGMEHNIEKKPTYELIRSVLDEISQEIKIVQSISGFKNEPCGIKKLLQTNKMCVRMINRCNFIIQYLGKVTVLDLTELLQLIITKEKNQGFKERICKKSMIRLLGKLSADKLLKLISVKLMHANNQKIVYYCCDINMNMDNDYFHEKVRGAKAKYFSTNVSQKGPIIPPGSSVINELRPLLNEFGPWPKFMRMQLLHEFLFYLLHMNNTGHQADAVLEDWKTQLPPNVINKELQDELPIIYSKDLDWKMFVPPILKHQNYPKGFMLLSEIIIRLPLSILVRLSPLPFNESTKEIHTYLSHPIKQHYLLSKLPESVRSILMYKRRYIFSVEEVARRLCYAGLLQFGPQYSKIKDQIYVYCNKKATLMNTTVSEPGYHQISGNKVYDKIFYTFVKIEDLQTYWTDLMNICLNTKLNRRSFVDNKEILIEQLECKPLMIIQAQSNTVEHILENDTGIIPGDNLGAAGLDSAFFAHLKQNWVKKTCNRPCPAAKTLLKIIPTVPRRTFMKLLKDRPKLQNRNDGNNRMHYVPPVSQNKLTTNRIRMKSYIRKVPKKPKAVRKQFYDSVDKDALKLMQKLRCEWSTMEDNLLLLCRIGFRYFFGNRKKLLSATSIRDILHWKFRKLSLNKTSRACQRRVLYLLKVESTATSSNICFEEIKNDYELNKKFGINFVENLKKIHEGRENCLIQVLRVHFVNLIYILNQKFPNLKLSSTSSTNKKMNELMIPNTITNYEILYNEKFADNDTNYLYIDDDVDSRDLDVNLLTILIHSSMCSVKDKTSWNLHFFNIFKNYRNIVVTEALNLLRKNQLISINKTNQASKKSFKKYIQLYSQPFHLSSRYHQQIQTKIAYTTQDEFYLELKKLMNNNKHYELIANNSGSVFLLIELLSFNLITIRIETPKNVITLDKSRKTENPQYEKILDRFQEIYSYRNLYTDAVEEEPESNVPQNKIKKIQFNDHNEFVSYNYHVTEKLLKLLEYELHIFCFIQNLNKNIYHVIKINENNVCNLPNCIYANVITPIAGPSTSTAFEHVKVASQNDQIAKCEKILNENMDVIKNIVQKLNPNAGGNQLGNKKITVENIYQFYHEVIDQHFSSAQILNKRDFGKLKEFVSHLSKSNVWEVLNDIMEMNNAEYEDDWLSKFNKSQIGTLIESDDDTSVIPKMSDLKNLNANDVTEKIRRLHDFFVVNSSKLNVSLNTDCSKPSEVLEMEDVVIPKVIVPELDDRKAKILKRITDDLQWPNLRLTDIKVKECLKASEFSSEEQEQMIELLATIESYMEAGAIVQNIEHLNNKHVLEQQLTYLSREKYLLRTGIKHIRFVHWKYAVTWTIRSFHILRKDREAIDTDEFIKTNQKRKHTDGNDYGEVPAKTIRMEDGPSTSSCVPNISSSIEEVIDVGTTPPILKNQDVIQICPFPWNRVNGSLNRRVLDRWLGAILLYLYSNPGIKLFKLFHRFNFLPPTHLNYLLDILEDMGCLERLVMSIHKPSLFSNYTSPKMEKATIFDDPRNIVVDLLNGSLTRLSLFMGNKKYKVEFL